MRRVSFLRRQESRYSYKSCPKGLRSFNLCILSFDLSMRLKGLEPPTFGSVDQRSIQLSYSRDC